MQAVIPGRREAANPEPMNPDQQNSLSAVVADRIEHLEGGDVLGDIVHAEDRGAARGGRKVGG